MNADHVGIETEPAAHVFVDVSMGIDHSRQHEAAAHVDNLFGAGR